MTATVLKCDYMKWTSTRWSREEFGKGRWKGWKSARTFWTSFLYSLV